MIRSHAVTNKYDILNYYSLFGANFIEGCFIVRGYAPLV